jgi:FlaA1/EpsC-like NDP-sugar epimerase
MMLQDRQNHWESLLGLTPTRTAPPLSPQAISGQTVMITGAGGSIGATLAHRIAAHTPRHIVLLDAAEQALYRIDRDLAAPHTAALGSVCDRALLDELFERHRPQIILHAAACKHVPLMEFNPFAALRNNAIGTFILAQSAAKHRVAQMVMVSTDKAVEPASIMGASKRIAELAILAMPSHATLFKAVRLGNVLASEGSVLPLFQSQIDRGQPLSVTHPEASRYFLTMSYAAQLLLLALSDEFPRGILVPQLGEPIRIEEIARRMLASTRGPHQIVFTGVRPGDKLKEKLVADHEAILSGSNASLQSIHSPSPQLSELQNGIGNLEQAVQQRNLPDLLRIVSQLVPDYQPSGVIQSALDEQAAARSNR